MSWVKLEGDLPNHPKILKVGPIGGWFYVLGLCYAGQHRTDGYIPDEAIPTLLSSLTGAFVALDMRHRGKIRRTNPAEMVQWPERLVRAGLWEKCEGGYLIHNYLERNPTKQYLEDLANSRREAGRRGGLAKALASASPFASPILAKPLARASPRLEANAYHGTIRNDTEKPLVSSNPKLDTARAAPSANGAGERPADQGEQESDAEYIARHAGTAKRTFLAAHARAESQATPVSLTDEDPPF